MYMILRAQHVMHLEYTQVQPIEWLAGWASRGLNLAQAFDMQIGMNQWSIGISCWRASERLAARCSSCIEEGQPSLAVTVLAWNWMLVKSQVLYWTCTGYVMDAYSVTSSACYMDLTALFCC